MAVIVPQPPAKGDARFDQWVYLLWKSLRGIPGEIPEQFNPIAGANVTLTGTYPDITFAASGGSGSVDDASLQGAVRAFGSRPPADPMARATVHDAVLASQVFGKRAQMEAGTLPRALETAGSSGGGGSGSTLAVDDSELHLASMAFGKHARPDVGVYLADAGSLLAARIFGD